MHCPVLEATRGAAARRADGASSGCTWPKRVASVHHANRLIAGRPRARRVTAALPYKGTARGRQLSSRGGSRSLPSPKAVR